MSNYYYRHSPEGIFPVDAINWPRTIWQGISVLSLFCHNDSKGKANFHTFSLKSDIDRLHCPEHVCITESTELVAERWIAPRRLNAGSSTRGWNGRSQTGRRRWRHAVHFVGSTQWKTPITTGAFGIVIARLKVLLLDAIAGCFRF